MMVSGRARMTRQVRVVLCLVLLWLAPLASAQEQPAPEPPAPAINATPAEGADEAMKERLERIYGQIETLRTIDVAVADGVVTISGLVPDETISQEALDIARRVDGVVAVQDKTQASVAVRERLSPFVQRSVSMWNKTVAAAPLILVALFVFVVVAGLAMWVASWKGLWRRVTPNPFVGDLVSQAIRVVGVVLALVVALNLAGATALMGAILGGAGVIGLAVGFAVRDSLENYISSIMLSLRQPFRANDHVVIEGNEGKVVRLTSRATILMTLDGNHLRIPNAMVYKAIILNYTRNPERRMDFQLGVDANDDPQAAIATGVAALAALDFVLDDPEPSGVIDTVGDSNIVLSFRAWINQTDADFLKARSQAIRATKMAVEAAGFTLPEPIYRLRIDQFPPGAKVDVSEPVREAPKPKAKPVVAAPDAASVKPEDHLDEKIAAERRETTDKDLLDSGRPVE